MALVANVRGRAPMRVSERRCPCHAPFGYGASDDVGVAVAVAVPVGAGDAVGAALAEPAADPDAPADPLGAAVMLGTGMGVGDGKSELGMFANVRANISTKMTNTITTQMRAMLSFRGGSEPR